MLPGAGEPLGLIAGNGRFPFLLLEAARAHGLRVVVAAIKEETDPEMNQRAAREQIEAARQSFESDPGVQGFRERFGATTVPETIRPVK